MSLLQQELKQSKPFTWIGSEALLSVLRTAAVLDHAISDALKPFGVTITQYNVLRILRGAGQQGLCGRDVGERLIAQVPDVPRLLERMAEMELLHRERSVTDRRHVTARITQKGLTLLDQAQHAIDTAEHRQFDSVPVEHLQQLIDTLAVVRSRSEKGDKPE